MSLLEKARSYAAVWKPCQDLHKNHEVAQAIKQDIYLLSVPSTIVATER
jgi:hypothetical protein